MRMCVYAYVCVCVCMCVCVCVCTWQMDMALTDTDIGETAPAEAAGHDASAVGHDASAVFPLWHDAALFLQAVIVMHSVAATPVGGWSG